jgi:hypothetical protein
MSASARDLAASVLARLSDGSARKEQSPQKPSSDDHSENPSAETKPSRKKAGRRPKQPEPTFPVEPRIIQTIKRPKTYVNHSYHDFSSVPLEEDHVEPSDTEEMAFAQKVHHILSQREYSAWITWSPHGRSFQILVPKRLEQARILQTYFGHNRYSSFLRQLNNHGFKHITQGCDRNCYYHEVSVRIMSLSTR